MPLHAKFKIEHLCFYVDIHKIFYLRSNDTKKKVFMNIKIILLFSDVNLILNGPMWMEGRKRRIGGGGVGFPIFWSHIVSPTGIFCASNDDDAWKPHEFYELISPHAGTHHVQLLVHNGPPFEFMRMNPPPFAAGCSKLSRLQSYHRDHWLKRWIVFQTGD